MPSFCTSVNIRVNISCVWNEQNPIKMTENQCHENTKIQSSWGGMTAVSTRKSRERKKGLTLIVYKILQSIRHLTCAFTRRHLLWLLLSQTSMGQTAAIQDCYWLHFFTSPWIPKVQHILANLQKVVLIKNVIIRWKVQV